MSWSALSLPVLRVANVTRNKEVFGHRWSASDWAVAAAGELGEALNKLKKYNRGDYSRAESVEGIAEELADTLIYLDLFADNLGIDLNEAVIKKFNRVSREKGSTVMLSEE